MTATPKACFCTFFSYQSQRRVAWTRNQGNLPRQALQRQDRGHLGVRVLVQFLHGSEGPSQPSCRASTCVQCENFSPLSNPTQIKFHEVLTGSSKGCSRQSKHFSVLLSFGAPSSACRQALLAFRGPAENALLAQSTVQVRFERLTFSREPCRNAALLRLLDSMSVLGASNCWSCRIESVLGDVNRTAPTPLSSPEGSSVFAQAMTCL